MAGPMRVDENGELVEDWDLGDYSQWQDSGSRSVDSGSPSDAGGGSSSGGGGSSSSDGGGSSGQGADGEPGILDLVKAASARWSAESGRAAPDWNDPTDVNNFEKFKQDYLGMAAAAGGRDPYAAVAPGPIASVLPRQGSRAETAAFARSAQPTPLPAASASVPPAAAPVPADRTHLQTPLLPLGTEKSPTTAKRTPTAYGAVAPEIDRAVQTVRARGGTVDDLLTEVASAAWRKESGRRGPDPTDPVDQANYARYLEDWKGVFKAGQQAPLVKELRAAIARPVAPAARPPVTGATGPVLDPRDRGVVPPSNNPPSMTGGTPSGYPSALPPRSGAPVPSPVNAAGDIVPIPVSPLGPAGPGELAPIPTSPLGPAGPDEIVPYGAPNQFELGLSNEEAIAACGPAAAIAFARANQRNPTAQEALQLARGVGWTPGGGMAGTASQVELLNRMGVPSRMEEGVDFQKVDASIAARKPVIIDTAGSARLPAGHYFVLYGRNQQGQYLVGGSGEAIRGGAAWLSPDQITAFAGAPRNAIYMEERPSGQAIGPNGPEPAGPPAPAPAQQISAPAASGLGPIPVERWRPNIEAAARQHNVDPALIAGMLEQESQWGTQRLSNKGAKGIMQIMDGTAAELGINANDEAQAIEGGTRYYARMRDYFNGDEELALAAYNAGAGTVEQAIRNFGRANFRQGLLQETRNYLDKVPAFRRKYQAQPTVRMS